RCDRKAVDAGKRSWRLHRDDSARHRRRACWHLGRPLFYGRELRGRLDHVDRRRDDLVAAVSIALQARGIGARNSALWRLLWGFGLGADTNVEAVDAGGEPANNQLTF